LLAPRNQKLLLLCVLTTAVFVAEIGEAPHVGQIDGEADHGQQEVRLLAPCLSLHGVYPRNFRPHDGHCNTRNDTKIKCKVKKTKLKFECKIF
jgi:hypothetical protein